MRELFPAALADIGELGDTLARHGSAAAQDRLARDWMKQRVTWDGQVRLSSCPPRCERYSLTARTSPNNWSWVGMLWGMTEDVAAGLRDFWLETPTGREQPAC